MSKKIGAILLVAAAAFLLWLGLRGHSQPSQTTTPTEARHQHEGADNRLRRSAQSSDSLETTRPRLCGRITNYDASHGPGVVTVSVALPGTAHPVQTASISADGRWELPLSANAPLVVAWTVPGSPAGSQHIDNPRPCTDELYEFQLDSGPSTIIEGTVEDVFGGPIAGARIDVIPRGRMNELGFQQPIFRTSSDDAGEFTIMVPADQYVVQGAFPGYSTAKLGADTTRRGLETIALVLSPGASISGRVVRASDGAGVANAELRLVELSELDQSFINYAARADAVSGPDGMFVIDNVGFGSWALYAKSDGTISSAPTEVSVDLYADVKDVIVTVDDATAVLGQVRERDTEQPIADAMIMLQGESLALSCSPSDREGLFDCGVAPPGRYTAMVSHEQYAGSLLGADVLVGAEPRFVDLELERGHTIAGRVSPARAGIPIRVRMRVEDIDLRSMGYAMMNAFRSAQTDADGHFRIGPLSLGEVTLIAEHQAHGRGEARVDRALAEAGREIEILLSPAATLVGRVSKLGKTEGSSLELVLTPTDEPQRIDGTRNTGAAMYTITVNETGDFQAEGLEPGEYALQLQHSRGAVRFDGPTHVQLREGEQTHVALELAAQQQTFSGVVVDEQAAPVEGAVIYVADDRSTRAVSDVHGEFTLTAWSEAATLPIRYHRAGYSTAASEAILRADQQNRLVVASTSRLVIDHPGVESGYLIILGETRIERPASRSGTTTVTGLLAGRHAIHVCGDHAYGHGEVELGEREARLAIDTKPLIEITGVAIGPDGEPLVGAQVFALPASDPCGVFRRAAMAAFAGSMPLTDEQGAFTLSGLPPGSTTLYFIDATTKPARELMTTVALEAGRERQQLGEVRL